MGDSTFGAADAFAGTWGITDDQDADGIVRLEIRTVRGEWTIRAWSQCDISNEELSRGWAVTYGDDPDHQLAVVSPPVTTLWLLADSVCDTEMKYGFASWDAGFCDRHLTLRLEAGRVIAEEFTVFKDGSGRSNYRWLFKFKKVEQPAEPGSRPPSAATPGS